MTRSAAQLASEQERRDKQAFEQARRRIAAVVEAARTLARARQVLPHEREDGGSTAAGGGGPNPASGDGAPPAQAQPRPGTSISTRGSRFFFDDWSRDADDHCQRMLWSDASQPRRRSRVRLVATKELLDGKGPWRRQIVGEGDIARAAGQAAKDTDGKCVLRGRRPPWEEDSGPRPGYTFTENLAWFVRSTDVSWIGRRQGEQESDGLRLAKCLNLEGAGLRGASLVDMAQPQVELNALKDELADHGKSWVRQAAGEREEEEQERPDEQAQKDAQACFDAVNKVGKGPDVLKDSLVLLAKAIPITEAVFSVVEFISSLVTAVRAAIGTAEKQRAAVSASGVITAIPLRVLANRARESRNDALFDLAKSVGEVVLSFLPFSWVVRLVMLIAKLIKAALGWVEAVESTEPSPPRFVDLNKLLATLDANTDWERWKYLLGAAGADPKLPGAAAVDGREELSLFLPTLAQFPLAVAAGILPPAVAADGTPLRWTSAARAAATPPARGAEPDAGLMNAGTLAWPTTVLPAAWKESALKAYPEEHLNAFISDVCNPSTSDPAATRPEARKRFVEKPPFWLLWHFTNDSVRNTKRFLDKVECDGEKLTDGSSAFRGMYDVFSAHLDLLVWCQLEAERSRVRLETRSKAAKRLKQALAGNSS